MSKIELDYMEYSTDELSRAAYVSSDVGSEAIQEQFTTNDSNSVLGDIADTEYRPRQSFTISSDMIITQLKVFTNNIAGSPSGVVTCRIETSSGDEATGTLVHANATKTYSPVADTETTLDFTDFPLVAGHYWIVWNCDNQATSVYWTVAVSLAGGYAGGHNARTENDVWVDKSPIDAVFKLYGTIVNLQCYSEDTIIQQGTYSLKVEAVQTDSLNDTLTKSGLSIDLTDKEEIKIWAYALRTGTHIQIQIHDSGGQTSTKDIEIAQSNVWTEITWNISGISNANKDDIDSIIIKIIEASAENIFYVDNFYAQDVALDNAIFFGANF